MPAPEVLTRKGNLGRMQTRLQAIVAEQAGFLPRSVCMGVGSENADGHHTPPHLHQPTSQLSWQGSPPPLRPEWSWLLQACPCAAVC